MFCFSMQNVGLKSTKICVKDLLGSGSGHDPLTVTYTVIGGWFSFFSLILISLQAFQRNLKSHFLQA